MAYRTVVGVYSNENEVISAVRRLHEMGYAKDEISILARDPDRFGNLEHLTDIMPETPASAASGAATGAVTGGLIGGIGALLASLGVLAIPGVGPFLAAGPIVAALGGGAAGAAVGGVVGALIGLGVDKGDAQNYEHALERGDLLVLVRAEDDRYDRVSDIFRYPEEEYYRHYDRNPDLPWNAAGYAGDGLGTGLHNAGEQIEGDLHRAGDRLGDTANRARDNTVDAGRRAGDWLGDKARDAGDAIGDAGRRLRDDLTDEERNRRL